MFGCAGIGFRCFQTPQFEVRDRRAKGSYSRLSTTPNFWSSMRKTMMHAMSVRQVPGVRLGELERHGRDSCPERGPSPLDRRPTCPARGSGHGEGRAAATAREAQADPLRVDGIGLCSSRVSERCAVFYSNDPPTPTIGACKWQCFPSTLLYYDIENKRICMRQNCSFCCMAAVG